MYGSPLRRNCPRWQRSATSYARCTIRVSALGWIARSVLNSGSSSGGGDDLDPPNRPSRDRTRLGPDGSAASAGASCDGTAGADGTGAGAGGADSSTATGLMSSVTCAPELVSDRV